MGSWIVDNKTGKDDRIKQIFKKSLRKRLIIEKRLKVREKKTCSLKQ